MCQSFQMQTIELLGLRTIGTHAAGISVGAAYRRAAPARRAVWWPGRTAPEAPATPLSLPMVPMPGYALARATRRRCRAPGTRPTLASCRATMRVCLWGCAPAQMGPRRGSTRPPTSWPEPPEPGSPTRQRRQGASPARVEGPRPYAPRDERPRHRRTALDGVGAAAHAMAGGLRAAVTTPARAAAGGGH